jgi:WD40 repeat protein
VGRSKGLITTTSAIRVVKFVFYLRLVSTVAVKSISNGYAEHISPSMMIPEHRLASLLEQVKQTQISNCLYHNTSNSPSLYSDHLCDRSQFPLLSIEVLSNHADEVYCVKFSNDGTKLASASKDRNIIIWGVEV